MKAIKKLKSTDGHYLLEVYPDECCYSPREWDNLGKIYVIHGRNGNLSDKDCDIDYLLTDLAKWDDIEQFCYRENLLNESDEDYLNKDDLYMGSEIFRRYMESEIEKTHVVLPVYKLEHSGIALNTTGFSCLWDSGQIGYIVASHDDVLKEYGMTEITPEIREIVSEVLRSEIDTFSKYLNGEVYGYVVKDMHKEESEDDEVVSCWGFYDIDDIVKDISGFLKVEFIEED